MEKNGRQDSLLKRAIIAPMHRLFYLMILLLVNCDSAQQRVTWIKQALDANKSSTHPSGTQIDAFFSYEPTPIHPYHTAEFQEELDIRTHSRLTSGNQIMLLPNAQSADLKLELIRKAEKSIWVTTFQIICDEGGQVFADALIKAAKRGIEVRFLVTGGPWTWAFSANCQNLMKERGIQAATMPYSYITNHGVVQLHDKIFIIDSKLAIVGGQNIGSLYSKKKKQDSSFRDTDAVVFGPVTEDILKRFVTLWHLAKPNDHGLKLPDTKTTPENYADWLKVTPTKGLCRFVSQTPPKQDYSVFEAYKLYASKAKQRIIFHSLALNALGSPEQETLWEAFVGVAQKPGGKVFLLTNGPGFISSETIPRWISKIVGYYFLKDVYASLQGTPIQAFAYPSWLHSKVYMYDNLAVAIGSFNFDETGLVWTESSLICLDTELAAQVKDMFREDLKSSYVLKNP